MIIERSLHPQFLSNTYLVGTPAGEAFFVDAGGPVEPLLDAAQRHDLTPTHVLLTHHHHDHVAELPRLLERWPDLTVLAHPDEAPKIDHDPIETLTPGAPIQVAALDVTPLATPGHTSGMVALLVEGNLFTGDTLFKGSVGGVRAPGHTTYDDLRRSIMDVLLAQPPETVLRPGHTEPTTVAEEVEHNPFVRIWRGADAEGDEPVTAFGDAATLVLWAPDYDGGHKAWVRWADGRDDIVPGSQVQRRA